MKPTGARGRVYARGGKRLSDVLAAAALGLATLPIQLAIAVAVRLLLGRPVLFRQRRPGLNEQPFTLVKFRTMTSGRSQTGEPLPDEMRMTAFGRILRRTSLDELPELWNVLRGDMSLVGPRPLLIEYLPLYSAEQRRRHEVRPGLTGWAQVNGRNDVDWTKRLAMDAWYVDQYSVALDLRILAKTLVSVLSRRGVEEQEGVTMTRFTGNENRSKPRPPAAPTTTNQSVD